MPTTVNFREIIDLPEWRSLAQAQAQGTFGISVAGIWFADDLRCRNYQHPLVFFQSGTNILSHYNKRNDGWGTTSTAMGAGGTYGAGATAVFCPTFSPMGTLSTGNTTRKVVLSTALPASVVANQLSNRGDNLGFIVRIIGNSSGGSGKIEERRVIANTSGTTPTLYLDRALSFTPQSGDRYEFLSGSVLFLNTGVLGANQFRRYDVLTNSFSSLSTTNLIATVPTTQNYLVPLDEQHVPCDRNPGEGYIDGGATYDTAGDFTKSCLTATAAAAGTLTGQAANGDAGVMANQFRNFQIRIVEDTATPTAVGQRRRITSHTAGSSPVYTLASNWTVTPSSTAKYVIENDTDRIIGLMGGTTTIYNYFVSNLGNTAATANTWDTTSWAARGGSIAGGSLSAQAFGVPYRAATEATLPCGLIFSSRGTATYDLLNIAGAATGAWTNGQTIIHIGSSATETFTTADTAHMAYNPHTNDGRYLYLCLGPSNAYPANQKPFQRIDMVTGVMERIAGPKTGTGASTTANCNLAWISLYQDGTTKIPFYNTLRPQQFVDALQLMIVR